MSQAVRVTTHTTKTITFSLFNKSFSYEVDEDTDTKGLKLSAVLPLLKRQIVSVDLEWGRKDGKKVLLFYKNSRQHSGYLAFVFAVEADEHLMKMYKEDKENMALFIDYLYNNKDTLNFKA